MAILDKGFIRVTPEKLVGPLNDVEKKFAPDYLYCKGDLEVVHEGPRVSIIGSRQPSDEGLKNAHLLAKSLVNKDVVIVSGLAKGIDTIAHKTCIKEGGKTVAVLGTPLDMFYPAENRPLQEELMRNHLVISQFPAGSHVRRMNFPMRNRMMALLSHASIIVEAGNTSGSLHQGWEALRLGRPLFILESIAKDKKLTWPEKMIRYGAKVISPRQLKMILDVLPTSKERVGIDVTL